MAGTAVSGGLNIAAIAVTGGINIAIAAIRLATDVVTAAIGAFGGVNTVTNTYPTAAIPDASYRI